MAGITISLRGVAEAQRKLALTRAAHRLPDIIGTLVVSGVKATFVRGENPDTGALWLALNGRRGQPLRDKGRLQRSIHYERSGSGMKSRVLVGTNLIYAATHQFGDPNRVPKTAKVLVFKMFGQTVVARRVSIPARRFLPQTDAGLNRATDGRLEPTIEKYMHEQWD